MTTSRRKNMFFAAAALFIGAVIFFANIIFPGPGKAEHENYNAQAGTQSASVMVSTGSAAEHRKPKYVRGLHLTAWVAGSKKMREPLEKLAEETEINTFVIDIKEYEGEIYVPGYAKAQEHRTFTNAIPEIEKYLQELKTRGVYLIARIVIFKDNTLPKRRPDLAVKDPAGSLWKDRAGNTWLDPYNRGAWEYNIGLAEHAVKMGFDEIQYDYVRFPSDGNTRNCRYSQKHSSMTAAAAIVDFLEASSKRIKPLGAKLSIDVFGLTTTVAHDMGIGQKIVQMSQWVDYVSPMVYPSHYYKGEYGIEDPNKAPYHTVFLSMEGAKKRIPPEKLRPYLQDFSLGHRYGEKEVLEQIQACYDNDIAEWLLWNPRCVYTRKALKPKKSADTYEKKPLPAYIRERKAVKPVAVSTATASFDAPASSGTTYETAVSTGTANFDPAVISSQPVQQPAGK